MAAITYPSGTTSFQTLISAATPTTVASATSGTIELGSGTAIAVAQPTGVLLLVSYTDGTSDRTSLTMTISTSDDGSTWYDWDAVQLNVSSALSDFSASYLLRGILPQENNFRVQVAVAGGTTSGTSTITVQAKLLGVHKPMV